MYKRKYALIVNRDDVLFTGPLKIFLENNPRAFDVLFYTDFFPPQANKKEYIKASLRITGSSYMLFFIWRVAVTWLLGSKLSPNKIRINHSLQALAKYHNLECHHVKNVNDTEFLERLKANGINTVISMTSQIYKEAILTQENLEFYNIHPSLLPNNKGRFPLFWAILKGNQQGITCHRISRKIDEGKIVFQRSLEIGEAKTVESVMVQLSNEVPVFIGESMKVIEGENTFEQDEIHPNFYGPIPSKEDIRKYKIKIKE